MESKGAGTVDTMTHIVSGRSLDTNSPDVDIKLFIGPP